VFPEALFPPNLFVDEGRESARLAGLHVGSSTHHLLLYFNLKKKRDMYDETIPHPDPQADVM
jgi:hypothetical protein